MSPNILVEQLEQLRLLNRSRYTLRALAKRINVSHSMLSQILSGKKVPSVPLAKRLGDELNLSQHQQNELMNEVIKSSQLGKKYSSQNNTVFDRAITTTENTTNSTNQPEANPVVFQKVYSTADLDNVEILTSLLRSEIFEIISRVGSNEIPMNSRIVLMVESPK